MIQAVNEKERNLSGWVSKHFDFKLCKEYGPLMGTYLNYHFYVQHRFKHNGDPYYRPQSLQAEELGVNIPESDYGQLNTVAEMLRYLSQRTR